MVDFNSIKPCFKKETLKLLDRCNSFKQADGSYTLVGLTDEHKRRTIKVFQDYVEVSCNGKIENKISTINEVEEFLFSF